MSYGCCDVPWISWVSALRTNFNYLTVYFLLCFQISTMEFHWVQWKVNILSKVWASTSNTYIYYYMHYSCASVLAITVFQINNTWIFGTHVESNICIVRKRERQITSIILKRYLVYFDWPLTLLEYIPWIFTSYNIPLGQSKVLKEVGRLKEYCYFCNGVSRKGEAQVFWELQDVLKIIIDLNIPSPINVSIMRFYSCSVHIRVHGRSHFIRSIDS